MHHTVSHTLANIRMLKAWMILNARRVKCYCESYTYTDREGVDGNSALT
jgi:hypothetical protein